jgi:hypothetical protein
MAILFAVYAAIIGIGVSVALEVAFSTKPDLHRLRHHYHAEGVDLEHLAHP